MKTVRKSAKLNNVLYDVRGPIVDAAKQMEDEGQKIIKLNIGNLAVFGFDAPEEVQQDMIRNLPNSAGYSDSKGIFAARKAVMVCTSNWSGWNFMGAVRGLGPPLATGPRVGTVLKL